MKKILSILLALLMIATTIPFAFAAEGIRTIYLIVPGEYISETAPFEVYLHTDEDIYTWKTDGYTEKIIPETDYQGNVPEEGSPAIFKISFSDDYTHLKYSGGGYGSSHVLTLTDADVYADAHEEILAIEITPEEISEISIIEASGSPVTIAENEKAVIFSSEYYGIPYGSVNNGTVLATYTRNKFINNGTVMGGIFSYIENNGVISGGIFNYSVINNGTVNGGDFSDEASVIYSFEGATVSDSVKENALVITSQPVTFDLTNLTHDAETLVTTPNEYYSINLYADEGYAVPENITVTVDGVTTDKFSYEVDKTSLKASLGIWITTPTGPITITAAGETGTFAKVSNLYLGETKIVANSILRQSSGDNWSYDVDTNTLTLDNFELITTGEEEPGLYCEGNLNLILKGENLIDNSASDDTDEAVCVEGDFYISGTENDSLTVKGSSCTGRSKRAIHAYRLLEVSGCKIYSYGGNSVYSFGISAGEIKIKDNASVTGVAGESTGKFNYGVEVSGILNIDSGIITGIGNEKIDGSVGIRNYGMVINGGTVEAYGNERDINVFGDVSIDTDAELKLLRSTIAYIEDGEYYWDAEKHEFVCTGHTGGELTCIGYKCTNCKQYYGQGDGESHFGGTATCTTPKKCTGCGELYGEIDYDNHSWSNSICTECGIVCTHTDEDNNSLCDACGFFDGADINVGEKLTVAHSLYLRFIPNVSGKYIIFSESTSDPKITLYNAELDRIDIADDSDYNENNGRDFYLEYEFTAGETYYFEFYDYDGSYNYSVIFQCKEHQGGEADCTNKAKCEACGTEYGETDKEAHDWSNKDGVCANGCGEVCLHENVTGATCITSALCDVCGLEVYDLTNHEGEYVTVWYNGYQHVSEYECCHIGSSIVYEDHDYKDYTVTTPADCVNNAWETGTCICGGTHVREIADSATGHNWSNKDGICANGCGETCPHESYTGGVCDKCGYECPHETIENGACTNCSYTPPFSLTTGEAVTYHETFEDAVDMAEDLSVIKLLKDYVDYDSVEINKAVTIDFNGHFWNQPSSATHTVTADVTFTDSVGGGGTYYGIYVEHPCTFKGGSYGYIDISSDEDITLEELLGSCCDYYDNSGEKLDLSGETYSGEEVSVKGNHNPAGWWSENETEHWKHCVNDCCSEEIIGTRENHSWRFGECTVCGYECEHSFTQYTETKAPTCTEAGTEVSPCAYCDAVNPREIPALNHENTLVQVEAQAPTCTEIGWEAYEYCTACDYTTYEEIPAGHKEEAVKGYAATCESTGLTDGVKCSECGEILITQEVIEKLDHTDEDGDFLCDHGCGYEFEKPAEPDTPDEPTDNACDHLCHKGGILGAIWDIINFFNRLFNINQYCECGARHYNTPIFR